MTEPDQKKQGKKPLASKRYRRWLLEGLLLVIVLFALHWYQTRHVVAGLAPEFETVLLDGASASLSDYRGQPLLLQFWASWCPVCRMELASIDAVANDYAVLSIALDTMSAAQMSAWMQERAVDFQVSVRDAEHIASLYGVQGVPTSLIIDADGQIRFTEVGYTTEAGLRTRLWWVAQ